MRFYIFIMFSAILSFYTESFGALVYKPDFGSIESRAIFQVNLYKDLIRILESHTDDKLQKIRSILMIHHNILAFKNILGFTPLISASLNGSEDAVELFLSINPNNINDTCSAGYSALSSAVWAASHTSSSSEKLDNQIKIIYMLLEKGANPNNVDHQDKSILYWAIRAACLSSKKANIDVFYKHITILRLLLFYGADLTLKVKFQSGEEVPLYYVSDEYPAVQSIINIYYPNI